MFDRPAILKKLRQLSLPSEEYLVFSGSVLAVHGIRDTEDIDIVVTPELFGKLKKETDWRVVTRFDDNTQFLKGDNIDVASQLHWDEYRTTLAGAKDREDIIKDIPFMSLRDLVQFKQAMGREKDRRDIELIKAYLDTNTL